MGIRLIVVVLVVLALRASAAAPPVVIPDAEAFYAPTANRLAAMHAEAQRTGWAGQAEILRAAALRAYEHDKLAAADAWLLAHRWAALFAQPEAEFVPRWVDAVNAAKVGHAGMQMPRVNPRPLGAALLPEFQLWLLSDTAFSEEFFSLLSPVDYVPEVFHILMALQHANPATFKTYAHLAIAIALVYDVPPPAARWPHGQVSAQALPRKLPAPIDAFNWWVRQDQQGKTYQRLARLRADELKFVVDAAAPFAELEWAQKISDYPLAQLERSYTMVRYRTDRVTGNKPIWPGPAYRLPDILATGGICADQAYFATQVGKARGVPTLLIYGAGNDARHAWFGFLDGNGKWQLNAGRYAEQRFVTGFALDPQTWREFSDHDLQFLRERFRELPAYRQSRTHALFAEVYLALDQAPAAAKAARRAVTFERRNQDGWELLLAAARKEGRDARTIENILREAALAFQLHPDLEAVYANRVAESLRARGQKSEADAELRRIALKNQSARGDLSVAQAKDIVQRAIASQPLPEQIKAYNHVVDTHGRGAGLIFFDQVVVGFVEHLVQLNEPAEAAKAIERARRTLKVEPRSQLDEELQSLLRRVRQK